MDSTKYEEHNIFTGVCKFKSRMMSAGNAKHLGQASTSKMHANNQQVMEFLLKNY